MSILKFTHKIAFRSATIISASPTRSITTSTFLLPAFLPHLPATPSHSLLISQRALSTGIAEAWRVTFQQVQNPAQLSLTLDKLFYKHPQPHPQIILHALTTFIRLASRPQNAHPPHHNHSKLEVSSREVRKDNAPKNQLEALLTSLHPKPLDSSIDLAHLAQTKLLSRAPPESMTPQAHKLYLDLLCLTSTTPSVPFAYLSELPKNTQTINMARSVLMSCARHNDIQLAHEIISRAYKRASESYYSIFWLSLGIRLAIAAQVGKIAALATIAWGNQSAEYATVVGVGFGTVVGARLVGVWALREMKQKGGSISGLPGLQEGVESSKPNVVRIELYEYFLSLVRDQEVVERIKMEMKEKGVVT